MNYFLKLNSKLILIIIFLLLAVLISVILFQKVQIDKTNLNGLEINTTKTRFDILEPKFSISKSKNKIDITANEGNFVNDKEILLKNNVQFKSKDFEIYSQNVTFNQENETATSSNDSTFIAKKTKIESEGFNIIQDGNIIKFQGKTKLTLSKWLE